MSSRGGASRLTRLRLKIRNEASAGRLTHSLLERLLAALEHETAAGIITLEGEGEVFCEGLDLDALPGPGADPGVSLQRFGRLLDAIECTPRPVIALVDGAALGGGLGLAAAADLVIATPRATFGLPETLLGLVPALVYPALARRVGPARARWLALGAATLSAAEAWRIGLVDEVTDDPEASLGRYERRLCRMDSRAMAAVKAMAVAHDATPENYRPRATTLFEALLASPETRARIRRFATGETPWPEEECS